MSKKKAQRVTTKAEVQRLITQSEELRRLTTIPAMTSLSPKRYDKLLKQLEKVDRAIAKITKIAR